MIRAFDHGEITFFRMARRLAGWPVYWTVYWAEGLSEREIARRAVGPEGFLTWYSRGRFAARNFVRAAAKVRVSSELSSTSRTGRGSGPGRG